MAAILRPAAVLAAVLVLGDLAAAPTVPPTPAAAGSPVAGAAAFATVRGLEGDSRAFRYPAAEAPGRIAGTAEEAAAPRDGAALFEVLLAPHRPAEVRPLGRAPRPLLDDPLLTARDFAERSLVLLAQPQAALELEVFRATLATVGAAAPDWLYLWGVAVDASDPEETARWLARLRARGEPLSARLPAGSARLAGPDRGARALPSAVPEPGALGGLAGGLLLLSLRAQRSRKSSGRARPQEAPATRQRSSPRISSKSNR